jgi:hypothetical protein
MKQKLTLALLLEHVKEAHRRNLISNVKTAQSTLASDLYYLYFTPTVKLTEQQIQKLSHHLYNECDRVIAARVTPHEVEIKYTTR